MSSPLNLPVLAETVAPRCQVLVIDDEPEVLNAMNRQLRREFDVFLAHDAEEALAILRERPIQVVISDERMPRVTGSELFSQIREEYPQAIRLLLTGYADLQSVIQAVNQAHIHRYITKPWDTTEIRTIVREAYDRHQMSVHNQELLRELREANEQLERRVRARTEQLEEALRELRDSEQRYRGIVDNINDPVMVTDLRARILSVNPAFVRVTGYTVEEVLGRHSRLMASGHHDPEFYAGLWRQLLAEGIWRGHIVNRRKNGEVYVQRLTVSTVRDDAGNGLYVAVYTDLTEEMQELERARFQAQHDALTGLPNRTLLFDRLSEAIREARRRDNRVGVLFIDLDGFKPVNDQYGHEIGDILLQAFAQRLEQSVRESDTVARLGGDEFVVVLREVETPEDAAQVARKILAGLQQSFQHGALELRLGASIGIALWPDHGDAAGVLLKNADGAMYAVKQSGRSSYCFHDPAALASAPPGG